MSEVLLYHIFMFFKAVISKEFETAVNVEINVFELLQICIVTFGILTQ